MRHRKWAKDYFAPVPCLELSNALNLLAYTQTWGSPNTATQAAPSVQEHPLSFILCTKQLST